MFVTFIVSGLLVIMIAMAIYSGYGSVNEMNGRYWAGLICSLIGMMLFIYMFVYSVKQLINPTLLITLTETGVIVEKDRRIIEIQWGEIESYMICRRPSLSGGSVHFYIFVKEGMFSSTIPKQIKIDFNYMKNKQKLKAAFDKKNMKELPADYEVVKNIK